MIAKLVELPPEPAAEPRPTRSSDVFKAKFEIVKVLKGEKALAGAARSKPCTSAIAPVGSTFLIMGIDPPTSTGARRSRSRQRGREYVAKSLDCPRKGPIAWPSFRSIWKTATKCWLATPTTSSPRRPTPACSSIKDRMNHDKLVDMDQEHADSAPAAAACT